MTANDGQIELAQILRRSRRVEPVDRSQWATGNVGLRLAARLLGSAALLLSLASVPAAAESLTDSLITAYANNPQLAAERARLRAIDETLAIAQSGYRPRVDGQADVTYTNQQTDPSSPGDGGNVSKGYSVSLNQPLYSGGQTRASVSAADANIRAVRENVRATENTVLFDTVTAYMNVIRDRALVRLNESNLKVLKEQLRSAQARFDAGEVTRTDVEQARASLAQVESQLEGSRGSLEASEAAYIQVVGLEPNGIVDVKPPAGLLPSSLDEAIEIATAEAPQVVANFFLEQAAKHSIDRVYGQLLPQVDLQASLVDRFNPSDFVDRSTTTTIRTEVRVPIYDAGLIRAQVRQAKEDRQGRLFDIASAREIARQNVVGSWAILKSTKAQIIALNTQVKASEIAVTGVRAEETVGQRTQLDILNAEQTLLQARANLTVAKRDLVVNTYQVLRAIGRMTATDLNLGVEPYDVDLHYSETNGRGWGIYVEREEGYSGYVLPAP
jgi:outer membrane protein